MSHNMILTAEREGNIIHLSGRIDTSSSQILRQAIHTAIADTNTLTLDFQNISYISSSGLRELLIARKRLGKNGLLLSGVNTEVEEILHTTGFSELLNYTTADSQEDTSSMSFRDLLAYNVLHFPDKPVLNHAALCTLGQILSTELQ